MKLERALSLINRNLYGYSVSYYRDTQHDIPRLSFTIFDAEEVVIFFYSGAHRSAGTEIRISITERQIVALFQDYYNNIFESSIVLKDADERNEEELMQLEQFLANWSD